VSVRICVTKSVIECCRVAGVERVMLYVSLQGNLSRSVLPAPTPP
jgi:hypothetical protein